MAHEMYCLQYLIYTLAVHRYLQLRLPGYDYDTHFGGVMYLFVRGMDPAFPTCWHLPRPAGEAPHRGARYLSGHWITKELNHVGVS